MTALEDRRPVAATTTASDHPNVIGEDLAHLLLEHPDLELSTIRLIPNDDGTVGIAGRIGQLAGVECPQCHQPAGRPHTEYCTLAPDQVWDGVLPLWSGPVPVDRPECGHAQWPHCVALHRLEGPAPSPICGFRNLLRDDMPACKYPPHPVDASHSWQDFPACAYPAANHGDGRGCDHDDCPRHGDDTDLRAWADGPRPDDEPDTCRPVEVDGETIRVHGAREMDEMDRAAFAEIVRAAKRRAEAEGIGQVSQPATRTSQPPTHIRGENGPELLIAPPDGHVQPSITGHRLDASDFDGDYQLRMITAYPVIAGMTRSELMTATPEQKRAAFRRILDARNLRRTHELYLADREPTPLATPTPHQHTGPGPFHPECRACQGLPPE